MKKTALYTAVAALTLSGVSTYAHEDDDPLLTRVIIDQLEVRKADDSNTVFLEADGWIGKDLHKLWIKTEVERLEGTTEDAEVQALYSRAIAPFWDVQLGVRQDIRPEPSRTWGVVGIQGLAPYYFDVDAAVFIGESGDTAFRLSAEYELLFTQKLILSPNVEINGYGQDDPAMQTGSGLADLEAGLRLRYEIRREIAPYVGVNWTKHYGETADYARQRGEPTSNTQWVAGIRVWF